MKSLRSWIILLINSLVFLVVVTLSIFSYKEFKNALDERVLLQLSSIKKLKRIQLEAFLQAEMDEFKKQLSQGSADSISNPYSLIAEEVDIQCLQDKLNLIPNGESFFDITSCARRGVVKLAMIKKESILMRYRKF